MEAEAQSWIWAACVGNVCQGGKEKKRGKDSSMISADAFVIVSSSISNHQIYFKLSHSLIYSLIQQVSTKGLLCVQLHATDFTYIIPNP